MLTTALSGVEPIRWDRYLAIDLERIPLESADARGALRVLICLNRYSVTRLRQDAMRGYRRVRISQALLARSLGASRATIARWVGAAVEAELVYVEPQGRRRQHVYVIEDRALPSALVPYDIQRLASCSGASEAFRRLIDGARYQWPDSWPERPRDLPVPTGWP